MEEEKEEEGIRKINRLLEQLGELKRRTEVELESDEEGEEGCVNCGADVESFVKNVREGSVVCRECGVVSETIIDQTAEWRDYGSEDSKSSNPNRCGSAINPLLTTLTTNIGYSSHINTKRLQKLHMMYQYKYEDRALWLVMDMLKRKKEDYSIPREIIDDATCLYVSLTRQKNNDGTNIITRGEVRKGILGACLYFAFQRSGKSQQPQFISSVMDIEQKNLTRGIKIFTGMMSDANIKLKTISTKPYELIDRCCNRLELDYSFIQETKKVTKIIYESECVSESTPTSVAAGTIYYMLKKKKIKVSVDKLVKCLNTSIVTITKVYNKLEKYKEKLGI